jgi:ProP effector
MTTKDTGPELQTRSRKGLQDNDSAVLTPAPQKSPISTRAVVALLAARFPRAFAVDGNRRRPLKVGIRRDLRAAVGDTFSGKKIKTALSFYVNSAAYLRSLTEGADRVGVGGEPAGKVSGPEAEHARERLASMTKAKRARLKKTRAARAPPEVPKAAPAAPGDSIAALKASWKARGRGGAP